MYNPKQFIQIIILHPFYLIDSPGVSLVAFHYSINKPVSGIAAGDYNNDVNAKTGTCNTVLNHSGLDNALSSYIYLYCCLCSLVVFDCFSCCIKCLFQQLFMYITTARSSTHVLKTLPDQSYTFQLVRTRLRICQDGSGRFENQFGVTEAYGISTREQQPICPVNSSKVTNGNTITVTNMSLSTMNNVTNVYMRTLTYMFLFINNQETYDY